MLKKHGGGGVDDVVTLAGSHHGTTLSGLGTIAEAVGATDLTRAGLGQAADSTKRALKANGSGTLRCLPNAPVL